MDIQMFDLNILIAKFDLNPIIHKLREFKI